jgi:uncharacterized protein (DUF2236 family)
MTAERLLVLGGGRALLLQLAHPLVAAGVADHQDPTRLPWDRLWGTLEAVLSVVFGDAEQVDTVGRRVGGLHEGVNGSRGNRSYRALDHELLAWVHATLVDSAFVTWDRFVGPLSPQVRSRYYEEMKAFAGVFGLPGDALPPDVDAFGAWFSDELARPDVSAEARRLAQDVLRPPAPPSLRPALALNRLITVGLLPGRVRDGFRLRWTPEQERAFRLAAAAIRGGLPLLPARIRRWPHAEALPGANRSAADGERPGAGTSGGARAFPQVAPVRRGSGRVVRVFTRPSRPGPFTG